MARNLPWENLCLVQAVTASLMLNRRAIGATVYFGVALNKTSSFRAHAWLRCGKRIVTGEETYNDFKVISFFSGVSR